MCDAREGEPGAGEQAEAGSGRDPGSPPEQREPRSRRTREAARSERGASRKSPSQKRSLQGRGCLSRRVPAGQPTLPRGYSCEEGARDHTQKGGALCRPPSLLAVSPVPTAEPGTRTHPVRAHCRGGGGRQSTQDAGGPARRRSQGGRRQATRSAARQQCFKERLVATGFKEDKSLRDPASNAGDAGSIPGQGAKIPQAAGQRSPNAAVAEPVLQSPCTPAGGGSR